MIDPSTPLPVSLPSRDEAPRCSVMNDDRRCVLPPGHQGNHVFAPQQPRPEDEDPRPQDEKSRPEDEEEAP